MTSTEAKPFKYEQPEELTRDKTVQALCRTDVLRVAVQVIRKGGENNLHAHPHVDGLWFVLAGRARFYTSDDEVVAELGPNEGVLIPKSFPYWFESASDEILEILQVHGSHPGDGPHRINLTPPRTASLNAALIGDDGRLAALQKELAGGSEDPG